MMYKHCSFREGWVPAVSIIVWDWLGWLNEPLRQWRRGWRVELLLVGYLLSRTPSSHQLPKIEQARYCVCVCLSVRLCVCMSICVYVCLHTHVHTCMCSHIHTYIHTGMHTYIYTFTCTHIYTRTVTHTLHARTHMYVYTHICTHTKNAYTQIYTQVN